MYRKKHTSSYTFHPYTPYVAKNVKKHQNLYFAKGIPGIKEQCIKIVGIHLENMNFPLVTS